MRDPYVIIEENNKKAYKLIPDYEGITKTGWGAAERNLYRGLLFYAEEHKKKDIIKLLHKVIEKNEAVFGLTIDEIDVYNEGIEEENEKFKRHLRPVSRHAALYFDGFNLMPPEVRKTIAKDLLKRLEIQNA